MLPAILGGVGALAGGLLGGAKKKEGPSAGNVLMTDQETKDLINNQLKDFLKYQGSEAAIDPLRSSRIATDEVANNRILGQLYGDKGALSRALSEEQQLAGRGFSLQPEDFEAYGQASGNIARQFGQAEAGLAEALSARGLSQSGVAGKEFMTSQGNKMEQLAQMQRQIANDRMRSNLERLGQTRSFLNQLGQGAQSSIQDQYGRQLASEQERFGQMERKQQAGQSRLMAEQGQANQQLEQKQKYATDPQWARVLGGALSGGMTGAKIGMGGGMF